MLRLPTPSMLRLTVTLLLLQNVLAIMTEPHGSSTTTMKPAEKFVIGDLAGFESQENSEEVVDTNFNLVSETDKPIRKVHSTLASHHSTKTHKTTTTSRTSSKKQTATVEHTIRATAPTVAMACDDCDQHDRGAHDREGHEHNLGAERERPKHNRTHRIPWRHRPQLNMNLLLRMIDDITNDYENDKLIENLNKTLRSMRDHNKICQIPLGDTYAFSSAKGLSYDEIAVFALIIYKLVF